MCAHRRRRLLPDRRRAWELRKTPRCPDVRVWIEEHRRLEQPPGVRLQRTSRLPPNDVVRRPDGSRVTNAPLTVDNLVVVFTDAGTLNVYRREERAARSRG